MQKNQLQIREKQRKGANDGLPPPIQVGGGEPQSAVKIAGHTMGTPGRSPQESIDLFSRLGLTGIEFMCDDTSGVSTALRKYQRRDLALYAGDRGLAVACLTPYVWDINSVDANLRRKEIRALKDCVVMAHDMGCGVVRAYGGRGTDGTDRDERLVFFENTVKVLQETAGFAADHGVTLAVENHQGTMTATAGETIEMITAVGRSNVRVLYDQANISYHTGEDHRTSLELQKGHLAHVHVKDYVVVGGKRKPVPVGEGDIPWRDILPSLESIGYDGFLSLEYEKKYFPEDLPDAEFAMAGSRDFIRAVVKD